MLRPSRALAALLGSLLVACSGGAADTPSTTPTEPAATAAPAPSPAPSLSATPAPAPAPAAAPAPSEMTPPTPIADKYRGAAKKILAAALADDTAYKRLEFLSDRIGHRLSGSKALDRAIAWAAKVMKDDGHDNVRTEKVMVPHWVRGKESAEIIAPTRHAMSILGLGGTIGTPRRGLTAEVVVVNTFKELAALGKDKVKGKMVLFNAKMPTFHPKTGSGYGKTVAYRWAGARVAAQYGAVAALVRSVTAKSLRTPHTGSMGYKDGVKKIPTAAVTTEDADLMARLVASGQKVKVRLKLGARMLPDAPSANVIGELRGSEKPDEIVVIGAHIDSWDVGQGAHDDGAGCVVTMQAITLLRTMGLRPKRTIRVVLFTNEENGLRGAKDYAKRHAAEIPKTVLAVEMDRGGFAPRGFTVDGTPEAIAMAKDITSLLAPIDANRAKKGGGGADITPLAKQGVPAFGLWVEGSRYFDYHHTHADTFDKIDAKDIAKNVAAMAVLAYVVADMDQTLPRKPPVPVDPTPKPTK